MNSKITGLWYKDKAEQLRSVRREMMEMTPEGKKKNIQAKEIIKYLRSLRNL